jgi:hypothetical protein
MAVIPQTGPLPLGVVSNYGALEQYMKDRDYALNRQQVVGNQQLQSASLAQRANESAQQAQLALMQGRQKAYEFEVDTARRAYEFDTGVQQNYDRMEQGAYEFEASRQPSELDYFRQEESLGKMQKSAELQIWANSQEITQKEEAGLRQMKRKVAEVEALPWSREEKDDAIAMLKTDIDPLERRQKMTQQRAVESRAQQMEMETDMMAKAQVQSQTSKSRYLLEQGVDVKKIASEDPQFLSVQQQTQAFVRQVIGQAQAQGRQPSPAEMQQVQQAQKRLEMEQIRTQQRIIDEKLQEGGGFPMWSDPNTGKKYPLIWDKEGQPEIVGYKGPEAEKASKADEPMTRDEVQKVYVEARRDVLERYKARGLDPSEITDEKLNRDIQHTAEWMFKMREEHSGTGGKSGTGSGRERTLPGGPGGGGRETALPGDPRSKPVEAPAAATSAVESVRKQIESAGLSPDAKQSAYYSLNAVERLVKEHGSYETMPPDAREEYDSNMKGVRLAFDVDRTIRQETERRRPDEELQRRRQESERRRSETEGATAGMSMAAKTAYQGVQNAKMRLEEARAAGETGRPLEIAEMNLRAAQAELDRWRE